MAELTQGLIYYVVFLFSTTLHEAAHAWAARRGGDLTAYHGGQVSLDPLPHIRREPFGMVLLPLLSVAVSGWPFGYASAPYDPAWAERHPRRAAWMALAGPAANVLLVLLAAGLLRLGIAVGVFSMPASVKFGHLVEAQGAWDGAALLVSAFFSMNLLLAVFNLLPLPPLDGSGAAPLLLSPTATRGYQRFLRSSPMLGVIGMLLAWQVFSFIFNPIFLGAVNLLYPGAGFH
ncbi:MAG TPA: site-2 protease family protein [Longimicrobiales bacterium]